MIFIDQDGTCFTGRLKPEVSPSGHPIEVLELRPAWPAKPTRVEPYGPCPFLLLEATPDEVSRLDRAAILVRRARR